MYLKQLKSAVSAEQRKQAVFALRVRLIHPFAQSSRITIAGCNAAMQAQADAGFSYAIYLMALADRDNAAVWTQKAATLGMAQAQCSLAGMLSAVVHARARDSDLRATRHREVCVWRRRVQRRGEGGDAVSAVG